MSKKLKQNEVNIEDPLYKITLKHMESGASAEMKNIPSEHRGFEGGVRRTSGSARRMHARYMTFIRRNNLHLKGSAKKPQVEMQMAAA